MQVSLPPFFINKQKHNHSFLPSLRDLQCGSDDDGSGTKSRGTLKLTSRMAHTIKRILEEDPDADIDKLDFFSDED